MKSIILATVLTLVMLSPTMAADVPGMAGTLLAASNQPGPGKPGADQPGPSQFGPSRPGQDRPSVLIIKGEGGKVIGVEKPDQGKKKKGWR